MKLDNNMHFASQQIPRQNPEEYAKQYANENGISINEARVQLREKYGDPQSMDASVFNTSGFGQNISSQQHITNEDIEEFQNLQDLVFGQNNNNNFSIINPQTNTITGPQKEGDPQLNLFESIMALFNKGMEKTQELQKDNCGENSQVKTIDDIKELIGLDSFNNLMKEGGFDEHSSTEEIIKYFNEINKYN